MIATADPTNQEAAEKIKFTAQVGVDWLIAEHDKLVALVDQITKTTTNLWSLFSSAADFDLEEVKDVDESNKNEADGSDVEDAPVVKFLHKMLIDAFNMRASDLHFEPYEHNYRVRFRIDGELREIAAPPIAIKDKLASRIKVISRLDISEKRVPQDGRMKLENGAGRKSLTFGFLPCPLYLAKNRYSYFGPSSAKMGIDALGYEPEEKERLLNAISRPYGMILVTGPTGSGKTRVALQLFESFEQAWVNISTAEDPSEINVPGVNRVNVNDKAGLTFAAALKSFLRQDPDVDHGG